MVVFAYGPDCSPADPSQARPSKRLLRRQLARPSHTLTTLTCSLICVTFAPCSFSRSDSAALSVGLDKCHSR